MKKYLLSLALALCACPGPQIISTPCPTSPDANGTTAKKEWTLLVYMAADQTDLKPYAYMNLYEMESAFAGDARTAATTDTTNLVVQIDTPGQKGIRRLQMTAAKDPYDSTLTKQYFEARTEADIRSKVVQLLDEPEKATGADAARDLKSFLHWGVTTYPARHYMVIVWGHGRGFAAAQKPNADPISSPRGIAADENQGTYIDTPALRDTLQQVVTEDLGGRPFDIYASDACLMQSLEVATELSNVARYIVGSAQIQPFSGLPYRQLLHEINSGHFGVNSATGATSEDSAYLIARMLPEMAASTLRGDGLQARLSPDAKKTFTLSALRARDVKDTLVPALHEVGKQLSATIAAVPIRGAQLGAHIQRMPSFLGGATDVGYFLTRTRDTLITSGWCKEGEIAGEEVVQCSDRATTSLLISIISAQQALGRSVISSTYGDEYMPATNPARMTGFAAVSVWLPRSDRDYSNRIKDFSTSAFYQSGPWGSFLTKIFDPQAAN